MNKTIIIHPDGTHTTQRWGEGTSPGLTYLNEAVGGYIEAVPYWTTWVEEDHSVVRCVVYCNEYGKLEKMPLNAVATLAWDGALKRVRTRANEQVFPHGLRHLNDQLVGSIVILIGEEDFIDPKDEEEP